MATPRQKLLTVIPATIAGSRDRASILTLVMTGRQPSEVINLTAKDITFEDQRAFDTYRGKGGKQGRRELPRPAYVAVLAMLGDAGKSLPSMEPSGSLCRQQPETRSHLRNVLQPPAQVHGGGRPPTNRR